MPRTEMIRARVDSELKAEAEEVLERLGLNASEAIRLFYRQITLQRGLPFDVRIPNAATRTAILDARAGKDVEHYAGAAEMFEKLLRL